MFTMVSTNPYMEEDKNNKSDKQHMADMQGRAYKMMVVMFSNTAWNLPGRQFWLGPLLSSRVEHHAQYRVSKPFFYPYQSVLCTEWTNLAVKEKT